MNCTCQLYICVGFQCHTWEVKPSRQFGYEGQPCMLSLVSGLIQKHLVLETDLCLDTTRFVPFDEVGRKVTSPSNISSDFRVFTWIFCRFHFLLVLPSSRTFLQWHYSSSVFFSAHVIWSTAFPSAANWKLFQHMSVLWSFSLICVTSSKVDVYICERLFDLLECCLGKSNLCF